MHRRYFQLILGKFLGMTPPHAFLYGDDLIDRHVGELVHATIGPGNFKRLYDLPLPQSEMNARVLGSACGRIQLYLTRLRRSPALSERHRT